MMTSLVLPPCRICGEKASGFHFGVNTCEACKAFFRRSLGKFETFVCNKNKSCDLPPGRRNFCSYCRFKKCVVLGMCRDAIKTGRYTHEKKASDIKELKGVNEWSAPVEDLPHSDLQQRLVKIQHEHQLITDQPELNKYRKHPKVKSHQKKSSTKKHATHGERCGNDIGDIQTALDSCSLLTSSDGSSCSDMLSLLNSLDSNPSPDVCSSSVASSLSYFTSDEISLMENVIDRLVVVYRANLPYQKEFMEEIHERGTNYIRQKETHEEVFGHMKTVSREEYMSLYEATGIDLDGRLELLQKTMPHIENSVKRAINFAKATPGFENLSPNDQLSRLKTTRHYCWMILHSNCFNHDLQLHASIGGEISSLDDFQRYHENDDLFNVMFSVQRKINDLNLNEREAATFAAFCVMSEDQEGVECRDELERNQELLLRCLTHLCYLHHPEDKRRLTRLIDCFLYMRTYRDDILKEEKTMLKQWIGLVEFPPYLLSVWTSTHCS